MANPTQMDFVPRKPMTLERSRDKSILNSERYEFLTEGIHTGILYFEFEECSINDRIMFNVFSYEKDDKEFTRFKLPHIHVNVHRSRPEIFHVTERCEGEKFSHHYGKRFVKHYEQSPEKTLGWVTNNKGDQILADICPVYESYEILHAIYLAFISFKQMSPSPEISPTCLTPEKIFDMRDHIFIDSRTLRAIEHRKKKLAAAPQSQSQSESE